ncbi:DUF3159 domain-containing protein [Mumia zhuanghuii]|uniref:DUF3159 domain-containing protein n=1 Tax=Mumia zhuanghuii TaxID=2585211 RepID=A0A5C4M8V2_9ACTN|nr:DUF3159 domain-containing protein [Mumia zhuanghuii]TNC29341.1 DUF3159 domain-containing protein [Mumia zhuanghuii]TNC49671.1 DUF3159 domain-containing protein [Mumia zhuanghuii]
MSASTPSPSAPDPAEAPASPVTVEQVVRAQLAKALGGVRGMLEAAVPTIGFTLTWIIARDLQLALWIGGGVAVALLVVRLVQRSTTQFVLNSLFGIAIAAVFALRSGEARDAFLPGMIYNGGYAVVLVFTVLIGWPIVGFIVGSVTGDPTGWHRDKALVRLCSRLTLILALPCVLRVVVQYPLWAADQVALLGTAKVVMGWPLQVATLAGMVYLLGRNHTPVSDPEAAGVLLSQEALEIQPKIQPRD